MSVVATKNVPQKGATVEIVHNNYSLEQELSSTLLRIGSICTVVAVSKAKQSNEKAVPLYECYIKFKTGEIEPRFASNLKIIG